MLPPAPPDLVPYIAGHSEETAQQPPGLIPAGPGFALMAADDTWHAVSAPIEWASLVLDRLGADAGAVIEDTAIRHLVWLVPAGGADDWPPVPSCRLTVYRTGQLVTVPALGSDRGGVRWLRPPDGERLFTQPPALFLAVEHVIGPLDNAAALGPVHVCRVCRTATRNAHLAHDLKAQSGPMRTSYACEECWQTGRRDTSSPEFWQRRRGTR